MPCLGDFKRWFINVYIIRAPTIPPSIASTLWREREEGRTSGRVGVCFVEFERDAFDKIP